jgi:hypothetical protein
MPLLGPHTKFPALVDALPPLVKKQRRLAGKIAQVALAVIDEKNTRAEIDALLIKAGLRKSDVVTCAGYDVRHNEKAGQTSINPVVLTEQLKAAGVAPEVVAAVLLAATETGNPALFATVTPSKGAKVRV